MKPLLDQPLRCSGTWYPETLNAAQRYWKPAASRVTAKAIVVPHAGWTYSGTVAAEVYGRLTPPDVAIVVGPNHAGSGKSDVSLYPRGRWTLPDYSIELDEAFGETLLRRSEFLSVDPQAFPEEHCIEVQVPFLLLLNRHIKLVPILMREYDREVILDLGQALAAACREYQQEKVLLIASSDMTHYEPQTSAEEKDRAAISHILELDLDGFVKTVDRLGISMCGWGPVAAVLAAAGILGAKKGHLVRYATSAEVTHEFDTVVGYAGILII